MAEFVVMTAGCLLLLFVLVPVVAKLSDMSYKAQELARYTAWERTVWYNSFGSSDTLPSQIDTKDGYLAIRSDAAILNSAEQRLLPYEATTRRFAATDIDQPTASNNLWRWTHSGQAMTTAGSAAASSGLLNSATPSTAYSVLDTYNDVMGTVNKVLKVISFGGGDDDFLQVAHPTQNFYKSTIDIPVPMAGGRLGGQPLLGDRFANQLNVKANSAVLADGWVAQSEGHFREKTDDFVLGTLIEDNPLWGVVRSLIGIFEPSFKDVNFAPVSTKPMPDGDVNCNTTTGFCYFK
ncbi:hypothetical protein IB229_04535 [Pseudomonas sp. PDM14]|uniref:hypothetical protein n=1 Tax=Pseudomonas sp. PDM14 TaxID=2769288 RepID=UPI00177BC55E|nr:hypothetical protein [Pseudomonas sp. PDM14]MBD9482225.1 hypothetical protein [Pseudomonas sp. PDM14]